MLAAPPAGAATVPCSVSSLVSAISAANGGQGGGTVTLTSGCTYTLTAANTSTDGGTGLPVITGKVTVRAAAPPSPGRPLRARRRSGSSMWPRAAA